MKFAQLPSFDIIIADAALGAGGTCVELWLPSYTALSDLSDPALEL